MWRQPFKHKQVGLWARTLIIGIKPCLISRRLTCRIAILFLVRWWYLVKTAIPHLLWRWCPQETYRCYHCYYWFKRYIWVWTKIVLYHQLWYPKISRLVNWKWLLLCLHGIHWEILRAHMVRITNPPQAGGGHWYKNATINRLTCEGNHNRDKRMPATP